MKRVSSLIGNNLVVLLTPVLNNEIDLILQPQQKQHSLLPGHALDVRFVDFEDFVTRLQSLQRCRRPRLHSRDKNASLVAPRQSDSNGTLLLECDESRVGPKNNSKILILYESSIKKQLTLAFCFFGWADLPRKAACGTSSSPPDGAGRVLVAGTRDRRLALPVCPAGSGKRPSRAPSTALACFWALGYCSCRRPGTARGHPSSAAARRGSATSSPTCSSAGCLCCWDLKTILLS